jgi:hypothetical protein
MPFRWITGWLLWLCIGFSTGTQAEGADTQPGEQQKGLTVDDLARGLRSAARNIEQEIPKIGPAIGKAVKSLGEKSSGKTGSQNPSSDKK